MPGISDCKCILVVGATSGIGRSLALAIHALPSNPTVIVSGRRQERLDKLSKTGERLETVRFDVNGSRDDLKRFVQEITSNHPDVCTHGWCGKSRTWLTYFVDTWKIDAVMFSSGVQHIIDFTKPENIDLDGELNITPLIFRMLTSNRATSR